MPPICHTKIHRCGAFEIFNSLCNKELAQQKPPTVALS
jgi:hypothetical protein